VQGLQHEKDTSTWFLRSTLHLWLCFVRLRSEGSSGAYLSQELFNNLWLDDERRVAGSVSCSLARVHARAAGVV